MNVSLLPEFEELINEKVQSGPYGSSDEVVNAALQLLKERDHAEDRLETLLQEADESRQKVPVYRRQVGRATPAVTELSSRNFVRPRQFLPQKSPKSRMHKGKNQLASTLQGYWVAGGSVCA